jgi:hypothetical protein
MFSKKLLLALGILALCVAALPTPSTSNALPAQNSTCPAIVKTALEAANTQCARTGRNKACYGNFAADISLKDAAASFEKPGDTVNVSAITSLRLAAMDEANTRWGVVVMKVQANLPDSKEDDFVTLVLFGDVQLTNASTDQAEGVPAGYQPMQAFYYKTGGKAPCAEAPRDGILIQTPKGKEKVELWVNGATVRMGSTAFLEILPNGEMSVNNIEGEVEVTAGGKTQMSAPGQRIWVPMKVIEDAPASAAPDSTPIASDVATDDDDVDDIKLLPDGEAIDPQAFNPAAVSNLPLGLLPRAIDIPNPRAPNPRDVDGKEQVTIDGRIMAIRPGSPTFIVVAGAPITVLDDQLIANFKQGDSVRVVAQVSEGAFILVSITSTSSAHNAGNATPAPAPAGDDTGGDDTGGDDDGDDDDDDDDN